MSCFCSVWVFCGNHLAALWPVVCRWLWRSGWPLECSTGTKPELLSYSSDSACVGDVVVRYLLLLILKRNLKMLVSFFSPDKLLSAKSRLPTAAVEEACWPTKIPIHVNSNNTRDFYNFCFLHLLIYARFSPLGVKIKTQIGLKSEKCKMHSYRADLGCKIISSLFLS